MYVICDDFGWARKVDFEGLKQHLISEIKEDILENREEYSIMKQDLDLLEKVYNNPSFHFLKENIESWGCYVISINDLEVDLKAVLNCYLNYKKENGATTEEKEKVDKDIIELFYKIIEELK